MAYTSGFTAVTGATYTAAQYNTNVRDNFAAVWVGTTAGDMDYYASSTTKSRLGIGGNHTFLQSNGSAPSWGALVPKRQGGSATVWETPGTTEYNPTSTIVEAGATTVSFSSGTGSQVVTYKSSFTQRPVPFLSVQNSTPDFIVDWSDNSTSGFTIRVRNISGGAGSVVVVWIAIGA